MATIRSLLRERVTLRVRSVDRILLHAWVPKLMSAGGLIGFLLDRGFRIPSPALLGRNGERYVDSAATASAMSRRSTRSRPPTRSRSSASAGASRSRRSPVPTCRRPSGRGASGS